MNRVTMTVRADDLPGDLQARLGALPGTRVLLTAEPVEETDAERMASLRSDLRAGRDELAAGLGEPLDARALLDELHRGRNE